MHGPYFPISLLALWFCILNTELFSSNNVVNLEIRLPLARSLLFFVIVFAFSHWCLVWVLRISLGCKLRFSDLFRACAFPQHTVSSAFPWSVQLFLNVLVIYLFYLFFSFSVFLPFSWAAPVACGGSQARSRIRAVATGLRQSHSNAGSEPRLRPKPQLMATLDR